MAEMDARREGAAELREARGRLNGLLIGVAVFSFFVNLLMLTGPLYMLNVYDRVLGSRSVETLVALTVLVAFLFGMMGLLDLVRGRVMTRAAARFQSTLDERVFSASVRGARDPEAHKVAQTGSRDLESIQRLIASPALMSVFDLPFAPLFFAGIFVFHAWLGLLALGGAAVLIVLALVNQWRSRLPLSNYNRSMVEAEQIGNQIRSESELVRSLGMQDSVFERWKGARDGALGGQIRSSDTTGSITSIIKSFRLFLQSAMLGLGAYLVLLNELTPGAMIAGSILLGRALAPVEMIVNQSALFQRAREGWGSLALLLGLIKPEPARTALPRPKAKLNVEQLTVIVPPERQPILRVLSFQVLPGQAVGVIGTSGSGKSTLAKALTGLYPPTQGKVRLDGAALDQYDPAALGSYVGYLPQQVTLMDGTIRDNIARLSPNPDDAAVVKAAQRAAAHELILKLPDGYDSRITQLGSRLSGGQIQRIGLARAMYGDPVLLVLDEPNSNLDAEGSEALNHAIRQMKAEGKSVLIMAHRPAAIQECERLLVLEQGMRRAFGPSADVLRESVANHRELTQKGGAR